MKPHLIMSEATDPPPAKIDSVRVGIGIRVVPGGIVDVNGVHAMQATLVLSPIALQPVAGACGASVDLVRWPEEVEALLADTDLVNPTTAPAGRSNLSLLFSPVQNGTDVPTPSRNGATELDAYRSMFHQQASSGTSNLETWRQQRRKDVSDIGEMWRRLMAPSGSRDWDALAKALQAEPGQTLENLRKPSAGGGKTPPDIRSVGRGEAALLFGIERAGSLVARLRLNDEVCSSRAVECNLGAPPARPREEKSKTEEERNKERDEAAKTRSKAAVETQEKTDAALTGLRKSVTRADLAVRFSAYLDCLSGSETSACISKAAEGDTQAIAAALERSLGRHEDATKPLNPKDPRLNKEQRRKTAEEGAPLTRLRSIQSQPSLARLFNLVVDVLIPYSVFASAAATAAPYAERPGIDGVSRFGFLSAAIRCRSATRRTWTTMKIRLQGDGGTPDAWACTRAELNLFAAMSKDGQRQARDQLIAAGALPQIDGVVDLGSARFAGGEREPRFDIITLDPMQAAEARETAETGQSGPHRDLLTLRSVGMAVVDRWRETSALAQALASIARLDGSLETVIDAEDLTVGHRLDIAVPDNAGVLQWRSLCDRTIMFDEARGATGAPDGTSQIETLLARVITDPQARADLDAASVVLSARLTDTEDNKQTAHIDDVVGTWTGPPLGVDLNSLPVKLQGAHALRLGQTYSIAGRPGAGRDTRIPVLAFGGGYHFGLTPRLQGGVVRRLTGGACYRHAGEDRSALPARAHGPRRFLRHERIEAPLVTTPLGILQRRFDGIADGLHETARTVVVRSRFEGKNGTAKPADPFDGSYRVVVPPSVSATFADRHGCFESVKKDELALYGAAGQRQWRGPPDGLEDIDYDGPEGGFPVYGFNSTSAGDVEQSRSGEAIIRPRQAGTAGRHDPYYPDPAAQYIVIAARDPSGRLLPGTPLVVPVRPEGVTLPKVRPIAIDVVPERSRSGKPLTQERVLGLETEARTLLRGAAALFTQPRPKLATVRVGADTVQRNGSGIAATRVEVRLEPGESVEIDLWCLPEVDDLARWFDVIETSALLVAKTPGACTICEDCDDFGSRLESLGLPQLHRLIELAGRSRQEADALICAANQNRIPRGAVRCMAQLAHATLLARPAPELSARVTVTATHAIDVPLLRPSLVRAAAEPKRTLPPLTRQNRPAQPVPTVTVHRLLDEARSRALTFPGVPDGAPPVPAFEDEATNPLVLGTVDVDGPTTGFLEIRAKGECLVSSLFDDERRRRTDAELVRGLWPRSAVTGEALTPSDVYGFVVASDGTVTLPHETATLLRADDPVSLPSESGRGGLTARDLRALQQPQESIPAAGRPSDETRRGDAAHRSRCSQPFRIGDTKARVLEVTAVAGSRTAWCFRQANGDVIAEADATHSDPVRIALPATKAPAKVSPLTVLPAFRLKPGEETGARVTSVRRLVRFRIRMRRPWFSSGAGERLGIVLWPPDIGRQRINASGSRVARDYDVTGNALHDMDLEAFKDLDLGPGGAYITRWGADPIKGPQGQLGWLMPPSAFADLTNAAHVHDDTIPDGPRRFRPEDEAAKDIDVVYVPRASMPVPSDPGGTGTATRMEVALLTYRPRFDVDQETWYCDVSINPGTVPEPFARLGLVRYQPNAPAHLRTSEPVVEWVQLLNERNVTVEVDRANSALIHVRVDGTGRTHAPTDPAGHDPARVECWLHRPIMKVSVLRRRQNGIEEVAAMADGPDGARPGFSQRAERTWVPATQADWSDFLEDWDNTLMVGSYCALPDRRAAAAQPEQSSGSAHRAERASRPYAAIRPDVPGCSGTVMSWSTRFLMAGDVLKPPPGESYSVLVEEIEPMPPTTYPDEPIALDGAPPANRMIVTVSGPRFAARVPIATRS